MTTIRWVADLGMFAQDRSREASCIHATKFCRTTCFNIKLEQAFGHSIGPKDAKNDSAWAIMDGATVREALERKRNQTDRFRFCTRGEALASFEDVRRVFEVARRNPGTVFWIPTRAWHDASFGLLYA